MEKTSHFTLNRGKNNIPAACQPSGPRSNRHSFRKEMNSGIVQSNLLIRDLSQSTYLHQLELAFRWTTTRTVTLDPRGARRSSTIF